MRKKHSRNNWKIAYADFITALMALFIMLWILAEVNETQKKGLSEYFSHYGQKDFHNAESDRLKKVGDIKSISGAQHNSYDAFDNENEEKRFAMLSNDIGAIITDDKSVKQFIKNIEINMNHNRDIVIRIQNDPNHMLIDKQGNFSLYYKKILSAITQFVKHQPNFISIESYNKDTNVAFNLAYKTMAQMTINGVEKYQIQNLSILPRHNVHNTSQDNDNTDISIILLHNTDFLSSHTKYHKTKDFLKKIGS